jgi:peptide/nickel transport system permease protein
MAERSTALDKLKTVPPQTNVGKLVPETPVYSTLGYILRTFFRHKAAVFGVCVLGLILISALFAKTVAPHDPLATNLKYRLAPPFWVEGGSTEFLLGTDQLGRDVLSRIIYGARISLKLAFISATASMLLGTVLGMLAGYYGGWFDTLVMRQADIQLSMPFYVIAIAVVAVLGPSLKNLIIILSLWGWTFYGRVARGETLSAKEKEYIFAARAMGATEPRIIFTHMLPNITSPLIVIWTFSIATLIIAESGLSFLGLGVQPPDPSWGTMLSTGQKHIATAWWLATFPGMVIMLTILSVNLVGDALRDALDPRMW